MFIYSLPILFANIQLGSPLELLLVVLLLLVILYMITPFDANYIHTNPTKLNFRSSLSAAWVGDLKLYLVFWPFFILLNIILYLIDTITIQGNFTVSSWDEVHFILATPIILWTIMVWRNSLNTNLLLSASMARLFTLAVFFEYGLKLLIRRDYPRIFFSCQNAILDYAACF